MSQIMLVGSHPMNLFLNKRSEKHTFLLMNMNSGFYCFTSVHASFYTAQIFHCRNKRDNTYQTLNRTYDALIVPATGVNSEKMNKLQCKQVRTSYG